MCEASDRRELDDDTVTRDESWDEHGVHLIEGVVKGSQHESHADGSTADTSAGAADASPLTERLPILLAVLGDGSRSIWAAQSGQCTFRVRGVRDTIRA